MKKGITQAFPVALLGGALAFWGCDKMPQSEHSPQAAQPVTQKVVTEVLTPKQAAWKLFVEQVERGERIDPLGQYVSKATQVKATGRTRRPKVEPDARWYQRVTRQAGRGTTTITAMATQDTCDPLALECVGTGGGGGDGIFKTFTTSENLGGSGYIHDLKLVEGDDNSTSTTSTVGAGYTKLYADLNKGAGGAYIYLCFQRDPNQVLNGVEYTYGYAYSGPNEILTAFQTQYGSFTNSTPKPDPYFYSIWVPNQNPNVYWDRVDLNAGAGGDYIYSFQAKNPVVSNYTYVHEIGILSGNSSAINPPAGWGIYRRDLNEGAGGEYIYFCYR